MNRAANEQEGKNFPLHKCVYEMGDKGREYLTNPLYFVKIVNKINGFSAVL